MAARRDSKTGIEQFPDDRTLVSLKTKGECRLGNEVIQVWTVELPSKHAEGILRAIKENVKETETIDLQHLRRFAKPKYLPAHVIGKHDPIKEIHNVNRAWAENPLTVMQTNGSTVWEWSSTPKNRIGNRIQTLYLLICPTRFIHHDDLYNILIKYTPFASSPESWAYPLEIREVTVPLLAPTSVEQASMWSEQYWPTFYRKTNPFGAHPANIQKAEDEMKEGDPTLEQCMDLAQKVADDSVARGLGIGAGCVIVERVDGHGQIIAAAGDARYRALPNHTFDIAPGEFCRGNIMGHAVMRAIGMIGRKRLRCASQTATQAAAKAERSFEACGLQHDEKARDAFFLDLPVTPLEETFFQPDNIKPDGYLCLRLEIFLTHEPCVMCSMALVHSRVGRVIFKHRMSKTGGLTAEMNSNHTGPVGLGYGLCWRKELNWQFMCWEYIHADEVGSANQQAGSKDSDTEKYNPASTPATTATDNHKAGGSGADDHSIVVNSQFADLSLGSFASNHV